MSRRDGTTTKVFVGSLAATVTPEDLRKLFSPYGKIVECDIANRCGFLHLEDKELAEKAIEDLNNTFLKGTRISVEKGRVRSKSPRRGRRDKGGARGGRDRGGPYSRDDFRGSRNGMGGGGGRDYGYDRFGGYDRGGPIRGYASEYDGFSDRRPMYDDRSRDYMDDRRGFASNGYGRPYDDRMGYPDNRGGYDDRRMAPYADPIDDRRANISDVRPLTDPVGSRSNDMYSRRGDPPSKTLSSYGDRDTYGNYGSSAVGGDTYGSGGGYGGTSSSLGYGGSGGTGGYGGGGSYGTGYEGSSSVGGVQSGGGYSSGAGGYSSGGGGGYAAGGTGGYSSAGGGGGYSGSSAAYGGSGGYGSTGATDSYAPVSSHGGYGDTYGGSRGSYDASYSSMQPRSLSSGVGVRDRDREPRRGLPLGPERRY